MCAVFELPSSQGYAVSTFANYDFNLIYTDLYGQRTGQKSWNLFDTLTVGQFTRNITKTSNGNYIAAIFLKNPTTPVYYGGLVMLNNNLTDTIWVKKYTYTANNYVVEGQNLFYVQEANDGTLWAVGNVGLNNGSSQILPVWLMHLTSNGTIISQHHYALPTGLNYSYPQHLMATSDGGCLIGLIQKLNGLESTYQTAFIKVNATGQQEWYKQYGNPNYPDIDPYVFRAINSSEYWLAYTEGTNNSRSRFKGVRVNSAGVELETKYLRPNRTYNNDIYEAYQDTDGSVTLGMNRGYLGMNKWGCLWKFNANLDSVWQKSIPVPNYDAIGESLNPYHIIRAANGDYICGGNYLPGSALPSIFLTRLDSMGCLVVGTENATQADEMQIKVFPNPASNNTHIEWNENLQSPIKIEIINSVGQAIETIKIENNTTYQDIDTKNLPNGIYYLTFYDKNNRIYTTKFVVLHE
jgi:Secretion system C-terminal sorting domain